VIFAEIFYIVFILNSVGGCFMFKKIIAAGAVLALFACSSIDEEKSSNSSQGGGNSSSPQGGGEGNSSSPQGGGNSSSPQGGGISSSSVPSGPSIVPIIVASNGDQVSEIFKTYHYAFTMKGSVNEDLTPFWDIARTDSCKVEKQDNKPPTSCQLDMTNAILQHKLTNQYSPLHYDRVTTRIYIDGSASMWKGITLKQWNLTEKGDEAALGLNVSENETDDITDAKITSLNKVISFEYKYAGGAHEFRLGSKNNGDFWYYEVKKATPIDLSAPESILYTTVTIPVSELKGMGSYANEEASFDISKIAKFMWAAKYDEANSSNNKNSLLLYEFKATVEQ